jgi:hypothetical protein
MQTGGDALVGLWEQQIAFLSITNVKLSDNLNTGGWLTGGILESTTLTRLILPDNKTARFVT